MIVVDTNVLSELMRPAPFHAVLAWMEASASLDVRATSISVAEINFGIERLPVGRRRTELQICVEEVFARLPASIVPFDKAAANEYAKIASKREVAGAPIGIFDAQIAAICLTRGVSLATGNVKNFDNTGITVINPWNHR